MTHLFPVQHVVCGKMDYLIILNLGKGKKIWVPELNDNGRKVRIIISPRFQFKSWRPNCFKVPVFLAILPGGYTLIHLDFFS